MNGIVNIEDFTVIPNKPKARGMRVIGIISEFNYENGLENGYGKNIAKKEGIDEKKRDIIAKAIKQGEWQPYYYPKPATMEKTDVERIFRQLTRFTTLSGHRKAKKSTMMFYVIEFFDAPDEDGVMQTAEFWRRAWRTKENVPEEFDYIKSDYKEKNILQSAEELLSLSNYQEQDDGTYLRSNIASVLRSVGIKNPNDRWINNVRKQMGNNTGVMTDADDFDVTGNPKLENTLIVLTKTFSQIKDGKYDNEVLEDMEDAIVENKDDIVGRLKNGKNFKISVVGRTTGAILEKAEKIRKSKPNTIKDVFKKRYESWKVISELIEEHDFDIDDVFNMFWRGQKPDEKDGELYE